MLSTHRTIASTILAVLYGTLAVLGHALHYLPGLDHYSSFSNPLSHCCCQDHCHSESSHDLDDQSTDGAGETTEDCPICRILALCQDRTEVLTMVARDERVVPAVLSHHVAPHHEPTRLHAPRGPPFADSRPVG